MPEYTYTYECDTCHTKNSYTLTEAELLEVKQSSSSITECKRCVNPECRGTMWRTDLHRPISESFPPWWNVTKEQRDMIIEDRATVLERAHDLVSLMCLNGAPNQHLDHVIRVADWLLQLPDTVRGI